MAWIAAGMTVWAVTATLVAIAQWHSARDWHKRYSDLWFEKIVWQEREA